MGSRGNPNSHDRALAMMSAGLIHPEQMVTHHFPLERFQEALDLFTSRDDGVIKVIITM